MLRLFITDDHEIFVKGLAKLLVFEQGFTMVGYALSGQELLEKLPVTAIDVLLLDVQLPDMDAEDLIKAIRRNYPDLKIIYLTLLRGTRYVHKLQKYHIQGYILKNAPVEELISAIHIVAQGKTYFSKEIDIAGHEEDHKSTIIVDESKVEEILTKREIEVLKMVCHEYSSADIAAKLFLSVSTVDTHRKNIMIKLGVNNTVGLVKYALSNNLINN